MKPESIARSAPEHIWIAAGKPEHKYREESHDGVCATCAVSVEIGVPAAQVGKGNFANHTEFLKFGTHVCRACAWLYGAGRGRPGSFLAFGDTYFRPASSPEADTYDPPERPTWLHALEQMQSRPKGAPQTGVLTMDVKARLWPRAELATCGSPGLYVHAPDYDVSEWRALDFPTLLEQAHLIQRALALGYTKAGVMTSLLTDHRRLRENPEEVMEIETNLGRDSPEFIPAVMVAYKPEAKEENVRTTATEAPARGAESGRDGEDYPRLF